MSQTYTNVVVHVSGPVGLAERSAVEQVIAAQHGVARALTSPTAERLILVDYDPVTINAKHILDTVRGCGVSAQLVGM